MHDHRPPPPREPLPSSGAFGVPRASGFSGVSPVVGGLVIVALAWGWPQGRGQPAGGVSPVVPRLTRAELLKKWDLNGDGKLDAGEAEVANSKMRLERAEMRLNTGIDPVTGRLREGEQDANGAASDDGQRRPMTVDELAAKLGLAPVDAEREPGGAGQSPDATRAARTDDPKEANASSAAAGRFGLPRLRVGQPGSRQPASTGNAGVNPSLPPTGGVRAGGLPARPGYGSRVTPPSLNAGRADATATGGLVPRWRTPSPNATPPAGVRQMPAVPAPAAPRARRTVDDFDVYR